ncbi:hypothetical protein LX64_04214 [Chitinophaga skermanii]|uniref:Uncharacterized protein n=1 Tax=Chitinophaga skermanii TaxID=331697 RepID=A0A327QFP9_9BACT|nr:hypothetical protein LX64_04214 [Chitinophaga skermanii]
MKKEIIELTKNITGNSPQPVDVITDVVSKIGLKMDRLLSIHYNL